MGKNQEGVRSKRDRDLGQGREREEERQMVEINTSHASPCPGTWEMLSVLKDRSQNQDIPWLEVVSSSQQRLLGDLACVIELPCYLLFLEG